MLNQNGVYSMVAHSPEEVGHVSSLVIQCHAIAVNIVKPELIQQFLEHFGTLLINHKYTRCLNTAQQQQQTKS